MGRWGRPIGAHTPGIFISYRREDAPGHAGRLYDALTSRFGEEQVFIDLDMEPGVDFVEQINEAVASCRLLIAVIGPRWATAEDAHGRRRLDDPADFIRSRSRRG
jgi:TIR domain